MGGSAEEFTSAALAEQGHPYRWGGDNPATGFDCSGLVSYCALRCGVQLPRTAAAQAAAIAGAGTSCSIPEATATRGALLFRVGAGATNHVVISLGDGSTIEAMGKAYGVRQGGISGRTWTSAGRVPGLTYSGAPAGLTGTPVNFVSDTYDGLTGFAHALTDRAVWLRALKLIGGAGLVIAGVLVAAHDALDLTPTTGGTPA